MNDASARPGIVAVDAGGVASGVIMICPSFRA